MVEPGVLHALPWSTLTPAALLSMVVVFVLVGWLVPRWFYLKIEKERDHWREAHAKSEQVRVMTVQQVAILVGAVDRMSQQKDLGAALLESVKRAEEDPP